MCSRSVHERPVVRDGWIGKITQLGQNNKSNLNKLLAGISLVRIRGMLNVCLFSFEAPLLM
jgi:hypothetical protein